MDFYDLESRKYFYGFLYFFIGNYLYYLFMVKVDLNKFYFVFRYMDM